MPNRPSVSPSGPPDLPDHPPFDETIVYGEGGWGVDWSAAPEELTKGGTTIEQGSGSGSLTPYEIETFEPGTLQPDTFYIRHVALHAIKVSKAIVDASTAPTSNTDFIIDRKEPNGTVTSIATVTLSSGVNQVLVDLPATNLSVKDKLRVRTDTSGGNYSNATERVTINIKASEL